MDFQQKGNRSPSDEGEHRRQFIKLDTHLIRPSNSTNHSLTVFFYLHQQDNKLHVDQTKHSNEKRTRKYSQRCLSITLETLPDFPSKGSLLTHKMKSGNVILHASLTFLN